MVGVLDLDVTQIIVALIGLAGLTLTVWLPGKAVRKHVGKKNGQGNVIEMQEEQLDLIHTHMQRDDQVQSEIIAGQEKILIELSKLRRQVHEIEQHPRKRAFWEPKD